MKSQNAAILKYLKSGKSLSALGALDKFDCFRLAARINDLRGIGINIITVKRKTRSGKMVAYYRIKLR